MSQVLFCSDLHLGHDAAAELRGFPSVALHDHSIIAMLQVQADQKTLMFILGDVAFRRESLEFLQDVPGRKVLVRGNHDGFEELLYRRYFERVEGFFRYKRMWISHCPIHPQEFYRAEANIHGHIHYTAMYKQPPFPYINMNWDFWGRAVSLDEIKHMLEDRYVPYEYHLNRIATEHVYGTPVAMIPGRM